MYDIIKSVILNGGYKLTELQHKIKKLYVLGDITEEQADELINLATQGASPDAERPETLAMIQSLAERVKALEDKLADGETGSEETDEYPAWKAWDGVSTDYQYGVTVSHNGKLWQSTVEGQNVWEPGVYGWTEV